MALVLFLQLSRIKVLACSKMKGIKNGEMVIPPSLGTMMAIPAKTKVQKKRETVYDLMTLCLLGLLKTKKA